MSTFNGIIEEFPDIRIDYFRNHQGRNPPQACFLSHVHSDHLQGLETLRMPFVYCSTATKRILLRMEKYPHRINFAKGILEVRKQTYRALKFVLRPLPLETPVEIELGPKTKIQVTLFDANHCPGAVMLLIEGDGKAILYTGDTRSESWWVNTIVRNPIVLPYSCGAKRLDCIYLDTTFASRHDIYDSFPSKADGLKELLTKVGKCPQRSTFYFRSWTLGYEDVWVTLSNFLCSPIHVDDYQLRLFKSLADGADDVDRGPALAGFTFGNHFHSGCLTDNPTVSIHSCEPGTECYEQIKKRDDVIWITPIISRSKDGTEVAELGAGGGGGDLYQTARLEIIDDFAFDALLKLCEGETEQERALSRFVKAIVAARARGESNISLDGLGLDQDEEVSLKEFVRLISRGDENDDTRKTQSSGKIIHFPYSRHSSFSELRHLVSMLQPKDICPCTVDIETWSEEVSMRSLFGDLCSEDVFKHDSEIRTIVAGRQTSRGQKQKRDTQADVDSQQTDSQSSMDVSAEYTLAKTSLHKSNEVQTLPEQQPPPTFSDPKTPTPIRQLRRTLSNRLSYAGDIFVDAVCSEPGLEAQPDVKSMPISIDDGDGKVHNDEALRTEDDFVTQVGQDTQSSSSECSRSVSMSVSMSAFHDPEAASIQEQDDNDHSLTRARSRMQAYHAARSLLDNNDYGSWQDLKLRSVGWRGHTEEEMIL